MKSSETAVKSQLPSASPHGPRHAGHVGHHALQHHGLHELGGDRPGGGGAAKGGTEGDEILIFHGIFMGFPWDFHGIFMVLDKKNMGKMMDSTDFLKGFWIVIGKTRLNNDPPPINITPHKQQNVTCLMRIKSSTARNKARTITKQGKHLESEHLRKK